MFHQKKWLRALDVAYLPVTIIATDIYIYHSGLKPTPLPNAKLIVAYYCALLFPNFTSRSVLFMEWEYLNYVCISLGPETCKMGGFSSQGIFFHKILERSGMFRYFLCWKVETLLEIVSQKM